MSTLSGHKDTLLFSDWTIGQRTLSVAGLKPVPKSVVQRLRVQANWCVLRKGWQKYYSFFFSNKHCEKNFHQACLVSHSTTLPLRGASKNVFPKAAANVGGLSTHPNTGATIFSLWMVKGCS